MLMRTQFQSSQEFSNHPVARKNNRDNVTPTTISLRRAFLGSNPIISIVVIHIYEVLRYLVVDTFQIDVDQILS